MVVKMFKKILTRKKAPVSNRKYTKKNTKKKSKKVGGGKRKRGNNYNTRPNASLDPRSTHKARSTPMRAPDAAFDTYDGIGQEETKDGRTTPPYVPPPPLPPRPPPAAAPNPTAAAAPPAAAAAPPAAAAAPPAAADPAASPPPGSSPDTNPAADPAASPPPGSPAPPPPAAPAPANTTSSSTQATEDEIKRETEAAKTRENVKRQEDAANKAAERQDKALQAELTNLSKQNSDLTNKDGKTPERANMESNLKFNGPLPMLMKTFKKAKVNPGDKSEYFNLDNDSLKKLIHHWYGNKRGFFDKVLRGLGVTGPPVPVAEWDVSQVTNMSYLFTEAKDFNENISSWNVSNVQSMAYMFYESDRFSQNINDWDVGNVRNMRGMFQRSQKFNSYLDQWDTGRVLDMRDMFKDSRKFNRNIDTWNVSNVRNMERMFENTAYNKPLASWNVMSVVNMAGMFRNNVKFNQPLANWGSSLKSIKNLDLFLQNAKSFNQDLSDWNLSKIGVPLSMLSGTTVRQEFYPIGQRVNTQSQNMGLTPSEEKRAREKQVNAQVKADLDKLKESQEQAKLSYERQKMIHDEKLEDFKANLKQAEAQYLREQKRKENEMNSALAQEELELTRNRALLGRISGKPDDYKRSRTVDEARGDAVGDLTPRSSLKGSNYQPGSEKPAPGEPKPIRVPNINRDNMASFTGLPKETNWKELLDAAIKRKNAKDAEELFRRKPDLFQKSQETGGKKGNTKKKFDNRRGAL